MPDLVSMTSPTEDTSNNTKTAIEANNSFTLIIWFSRLSDSTPSRVSDLIHPNGLEVTIYCHVSLFFPILLVKVH